VSGSQTKVFGMSLGIDPKVIILVLLVVAGVVYYFTSSSSDSPSGSNAGTATASVPAVRPVNESLAARATVVRRSRTPKSGENTLKLVPVDGSRGDVDPTLRLGLLERLKNVPQTTDVRNLFDSGGSVVAQNMPPIPKNVPRIMPKQPGPPAMTALNQPPPEPPFTIPLKYYGFVKPSGHALDGSRGFFMDGENILVGGEGDVLEKRFLIVALTPNSARLEDTQAKQGQELQVTPEAPPSQQN
jgi:hypothetical protein